jgi:pilus assembly protein CpaC
VRARSRVSSAALALLLLAGVSTASAQRVISASEGAIIVVKGQTALVVQQVPLQRLSIADPEIAEVFAVSPREVMVNGKELGSTSLLLWDMNGGRRLYTVEVMPDTASLRQTIRQLYPGEPVSVLTNGASVVVTGTVSSAQIGQRIVQVAEAAGFKVINNLQAPALPQVMLQVRFAEVSRTAVQELGTQLSAVSFEDAVNGGDTRIVESDSEGLLRLSLLSPNLEVNAVINALKSRGLFRSLAEPNLLARDGEEASFLAGGEFPFPVAQGGGGAFNTITVVWKEFGIRLRFRPTVLPSGVVRLHIAPEVSSLDFSGSLRVAGFQIPSLVTRRAETDVELLPGQYLAIAGLMDNTMERNASRIPFLGDIPVLGELFRSRNIRESKTELLVIVSPTLVSPSSQPIAVPSGEPATWEWTRDMKTPTK